MTDAVDLSKPGYIIHLPWQRHFIPEFNPHLIRFLLVCSGVEPPEVRRVTELAFGQGLSLVINAAANPDLAWTGTDINPAHLAAAKALTPEPLGNLKLYGDPFSIFKDRSDIEDCDLAIMTGTWSWLAESERLAAVSYLGSHLAQGGVFCVDYLALPGQRNSSIIRDVMNRLAPPASTTNVRGDERVTAALDGLTILHDLHAAGLGDLDELAEFLVRLRKTEPRLIEHEFLNYNWQAFYASEVASRLSTAGLEWAGSWDTKDHVRAINLTARQQAYLDGLNDPVLRQDMLDTILNRRGRQDLWHKGAKPLAPHVRREALRQTRIVLVKPVANFPFVISGVLGSVATARALYEPLLQLLDTKAPVSLGHLAGALSEVTAFDALVEAVLVLLALDWIAIAKDRSGTTSAEKACWRLNSVLMREAVTKAGAEHLASPVTGSGVYVSRVHQLFLDAPPAARGEAQTLARSALERVSLAKDGAPIDTGTQLTRDAADFLENYLSIYRMLKLTDPADRA